MTEENEELTNEPSRQPGFFARITGNQSYSAPFQLHTSKTLRRDYTVEYSWEQIRFDYGAARLISEQYPLKGKRAFPKNEEPTTPYANDTIVWMEFLPEDDLYIFEIAGAQSSSSSSDGIRFLKPCQYVYTNHTSLNSIPTSLERVLLVAQTDASQNGIYEYNGSQWVRASDANTAEKLSRVAVSIAKEGNNTATSNNRGGPLIYYQPDNLSNLNQAINFKPFIICGNVTYDSAHDYNTNLANICGLTSSIVRKYISPNSTVDFGGPMIGDTGLSAKKGFLNSDGGTVERRQFFVRWADTATFSVVRAGNAYYSSNGVSFYHSPVFDTTHTFARAGFCVRKYIPNDTNSNLHVIDFSRAYTYNISGTTAQLTQNLDTTPPLGHVEGIINCGAVINHYNILRISPTNHDFPLQQGDHVQIHPQEVAFPTNRLLVRISMPTAASYNEMALVVWQQSKPTRIILNDNSGNMKEGLHATVSGLEFTGGIYTGGSLTVPPTNPPNGDKGDITVSNNGATWTIDDGAITTSKIADGAVTTPKIADDAVTFAKMQNIPGLSVIGKSDAVAGDPHAITAVTNRTFLGRRGTFVDFYALEAADLPARFPGRLLGTAETTVAFVTAMNVPVDYNPLVQVNIPAAIVGQTGVLVVLLAINSLNNTATAVNSFYVWDGTNNLFFSNTQTAIIDQRIPGTYARALSYGAIPASFRVRVSTNAGQLTCQGCSLTVWIAN